MAIYSIKEMIKDAHEKKYAVGAFVCVNLEMIQAVIEAAEEENSPVIVQAHPEIRSKTTFETFANIVFNFAKYCKVPVGLSLDHGETLEDVVDAISAGFNGVMIDGAEHSFEKNVEMTREVVKIAKGKNIFVEGSLGEMPHGVIQKEEDMPKPEEIKELYERTGIDIIAPAVGNIHGSAHGEVKKNPKLNISLIKRISDLTNKPICLHGGSSIEENQMKSAIEAGISKVIIFSDVVKGINDSIRKVLENSDAGVNPLFYLQDSQNEAKKIIKKKLITFGSVNKA